MGPIDHRKIGSVAKELRLLFGLKSGQSAFEPRSYTIERVAAKGREFSYHERLLAQLPQPADPHTFQLWIGGYSANSAVHDLWCLEIANGNCSLDQIGTPGELRIYAGRKARTSHEVGSKH